MVWKIGLRKLPRRQCRDSRCCVCESERWDLGDRGSGIVQVEFEETVGIGWTAISLENNVKDISKFNKENDF